MFEQTQTNKFALSEARTAATKKKPRGRGGSDYGRQLLEKQRVRYTYGLNERQLSNYAEKAMKEADPSTALHRSLEQRADSVVYRAGLAGTRRMARQIVSHGHILVNGKRTTTPSHHLKKGDVITIREGSRTSPLFAGLSDVENRKAVPSWLAADVSLLKVEVAGEPAYTTLETGLDYATVFEFYSR